MNLKDFTKEDITSADLKRLGASEPQIYMHKDGKTVMVPKSKEQEYAKQGYQKSSLRAETKVNERNCEVIQIRAEGEVRFINWEKVR